MDNIPNRWTDNFGIYLLNSLSIKIDYETVL